jgi:hypothetical protein
LLLFDSKLMTLECWDNSRGTLTAYDQSRLPIRTRRDATGSVTEIEVSGKRLQDLQPPNAVANFVGVAMQLPWIQLTTERGLVESGPPTASASPAQPSTSQAGDHAMIAWPPPTVVATTSPTVPVTSNIPSGPPEAPAATDLVPTPPRTADNKPDSGPVSSSPLAPQAQQAGARTLREELRLLKSLRDEDLIDDAEYAKRKAAVLDRWTTGEP